MSQKKKYLSGISGFGSFWKITDRSGCFGPLGPFWTVLGHLGPIRLFWPFWTIWTILDCYEPCWGIRTFQNGPKRSKTVQNLNFQKRFFSGIPCMGKARLIFNSLGPNTKKGEEYFPFLKGFNLLLTRYSWKMKSSINNWFCRQLEKRKVPSTPEGHFCASSCALCRSHGVLHCTIHP